MAMKDQAMRWVIKIQETLEYIKYAAEAAISGEQVYFEKFLKKALRLPKFKPTQINFTHAKDPFRSRYLTREAILTMLSDKQEQLIGLDDLIANLELNSESVSDILAVTDERGHWRDYGISYETIELVNSAGYMIKRYWALSQLVQARKKIEALRFELFARHGVLVSDCIPHLVDTLEAIAIPNSVRCVEPNPNIGDVDLMIVSAIHVTALGFPVTSGAVPEGVFDHPYARGSHPAHKHVLDSYLAAYGPGDGWWTYANADQTPKPSHILASSYMGVINALLLALIQRFPSCLPLKISFFPKHIYFEVVRLVIESSSIGGRIISRIGGNRVSVQEADILYIEHVGGVLCNDIPPLSELLEDATKNDGPKIIIVDSTLDPFLEVYPAEITLADHQILFVISSLTKFAQAGVNSSIGGIGVAVSGSGNITSETADKICYDAKKLIEITGSHMDYRLATTIVGWRDFAVGRFQRMQRNATFLARWLRDFMPNNVKVFHLTSGGWSSPLIFLKVKIGVLDPLMSGDTKESKASAIARKAWKSCDDQNAGQAYLEYLLTWLRYFSMSTDLSDRHAIRFGTSFGFDQTTLMGIEPKPASSDVLLRIAAGTEDLETLWWIRCAIASLKSGWFFDDQEQISKSGLN